MQMTLGSSLPCLLQGHSCCGSCCRHHPSAIFHHLPPGLQGLAASGTRHCYACKHSKQPLPDEYPACTAADQACRGPGPSHQGGRLLSDSKSPSSPPETKQLGPQAAASKRFWVCFCHGWPEEASSCMHGDEPCLLTRKFWATLAPGEVTPWGMTGVAAASTHPACPIGGAAQCGCCCRTQLSQ